MPAWPFAPVTVAPESLPCGPPRPRRVGPRADRRVMPALLTWRIWARTGGKQTREVRLAADAVAQLDAIDRQCAEQWLAGGLDRDIADRLQVAVERVARVRRELLVDVALRLAQRAVRAPVVDDWHLR